MPDYSNTTQYNLSRSIIAKNLMDSLMTENDKLKNIKNEVAGPALDTIKDLLSTFKRDNNFSSNLDTLQSNITDYIPQLDGFSGNNDFLNSTKQIIEECELTNIPNDITNLLEVSNIDDLSNLTQFPDQFVESMFGDVMNGTFTNVINDFKSYEFATSSLITGLSHNLGLENIGSSISNIVNVSDNLMTNFSDIVSLDSIDSVIGGLDGIMSDLSVDIAGNFSIDGMFDALGVDLPLEDIQNVMDTVKTMKVMASNIYSQITGLLPALSGCTCSQMPLDSLIAGLAGGSLKDVLDTVNDVVDTVNDVTQQVESITGQISDFKNRLTSII